MTEHQSKDPLHGITLEQLLIVLVERHGWEELADLIRVNCFKSDPSIKSSLKFLRRTPWARKEVEVLFTQGVDGLINHKRSNNSAQRADTAKVKKSQPAAADSDNPWLKGRGK